MKDTKQNWIIVNCKGEQMEIYAKRVFGTKQQVKKYLASVICKTKKEYEADGDRIDYASTTASSIQEFHNEDGLWLYGTLLVGYGNTEDYAAFPEAEPIILE